MMIKLAQQAGHSPAKVLLPPLIAHAIGLSIKCVCVCDPSRSFFSGLALASYSWALGANIVVVSCVSRLAASAGGGRRIHGKRQLLIAEPAPESAKSRACLLTDSLLFSSLS